MKKRVRRAVIEIGSIVFLFYSNLLMGAYERSAHGRERGLLWALEDVITPETLLIALLTSLVGYLLFEWLRQDAS